MTSIPIPSLFTLNREFKFCTNFKKMLVYLQNQTTMTFTGYSSLTNSFNTMSVYYFTVSSNVNSVK